MLDRLKIENVLFLDIETVPQCANLDDLPENLQKLWLKKAERLASTAKPEEPMDVQSFYRKRAGIYAEFGKIICISVGIFHKEEFRVKSYVGQDEKAILTDFANLLHQRFSGENHLLCAHNGKEFDFPYIARRMVINRIKLPAILDIAGRKPWEVNHLDTLELWKFGDYKSYTSLELLAALFGIPTPKDDIDGSQVADVYYGEGNLERIATYCVKDVITVAQIIRHFRGEPLMDANSIVYT